MSYCQRGLTQVKVGLLRFSTRPCAYEWQSDLWIFKLVREVWLAAYTTGVRVDEADVSVHFAGNTRRRLVEFCMNYRPSANKRRSGPAIRMCNAVARESSQGEVAPPVWGSEIRVDVETMSGCSAQHSHGQVLYSRNFFASTITQTLVLILSCNTDLHLA